MPIKIFLQPAKTAAIWQHFMTMPTHLSLSHLVQNSSSKWIAATDIMWPNCMTSTLLNLWEELYSAQLTSMIHCSSSETSSQVPLCCMDTYINEKYAHTWCVLCKFGIAQLRYRYPANFTRKKIKLQQHIYIYTTYITRKRKGGLHLFVYLQCLNFCCQLILDT